MIPHHDEVEQVDETGPDDPAAEPNDPFDLPISCEIGDRPGTDRAMASRSGLDTRIRNQTRVSRIRPVPGDAGPGVISLAELDQHRSDTRLEPLPPSVAAGIRRPVRSPADVAARPAVVAAPILDAKGRISLTSVARAMGWERGVSLAAIADPDVGAVTIGPDSSSGATVSMDGHGRVQLSPALRFALGVAIGDQVVVAGDPVAGLATVRSAGATLESFEAEATLEAAHPSVGAEITRITG